MRLVSLDHGLTVLGEVFFLGTHKDHLVRCGVLHIYPHRDRTTFYLMAALVERDRAGALEYRRDLSAIVLSGLDPMKLAQLGDLVFCPGVGYIKKMIADTAAPLLDAISKLQGENQALRVRLDAAGPGRPADQSLGEALVRLAQPRQQPGLALPP